MFLIIYVVQGETPFNRKIIGKPTLEIKKNDTILVFKNYTNGWLFGLNLENEVLFSYFLKGWIISRSMYIN